ncbi:Non-specific serine/threonine protein kinase [Bertholletia excelsa]
MAENQSRLSLRFFSLLSLLCFISSATSDELQILQNIKTALKTPTTVLDSWTTINSPCNYAGITCNPRGSVTAIDLSDQRLSGSVPFDSICQLDSLEKLSLSHNFLFGPISNDLSKCVKLQYLDLSNNFFSGELPDISPLRGLKYFHMNNTGISGKFPWSSIKNMTGLIELSLGDNLFDRTMLSDVIGELTQLNWLYLTNCSLEGRIPPAIGNLTELIHLELSGNYLFGEIPPEISNLRRLWMLELYSNSLSGRLPDGFGNLTSLELFDASQNQLEGDLSELGSLTQLVTLQLFENRFSGEVPTEFGEFRKLVNLSLYTNNLTGSLPENLGSWAEFDFIDVSDNLLTGPIPPHMCKRGTMKELLMLDNKFSGEIPATYATCTSMVRFRVSNNSLSGVVPAGIWGLPNAEIIDIAMNRLQGPITPDIGNAKTLGELNVANNQLSGELPTEISKATSLIKIELSYNQFSGGIPATIGELKQLGNLHLQSNKFSGPIPESISSCVALNDVNMAQNSLSGEIPASFGSLPALNSLNLSENKLSGQIPATLSSLRLSLFDLSYNQLTGPIPQSLSVEAYNGSFTGNRGLCSQKIKSFRRCSSDSRAANNLRVIVLAVAGTAILLLVSALFYILHAKKSEIQKHRQRSLKEDSWDVKSFHVLTFTEEDILDSIKQENLIGKGGSGNVYRVVLGNGDELAVKHIWNSDYCGQRSSRSTTPMLKSPKMSRPCREFDAEVQILSSIRHINVVKLYCSITSEDSSLLVYEYMPNGSLWDRLHVHTGRKMALDWETRYDIAVGAARGLEYLHHGCERPVIHRDVKSSNILLDEDMKPRIADFGLAKIVQANASKDSTHLVAGTHGYIAPEYGYTYKVTEKSDVYSFGVVLMELVTGKRPIEPEFGESKDIVGWVASKLKTKESVLSVVDSTISAVYKEEAIKVLRIALLCTAKHPGLRPTMRSVVQMLEEAEPCKLVGIVVGKDGGENKEEVKGQKCQKPKPSP